VPTRVVIENPLGVFALSGDFIEPLPLPLRTFAGTVERPLVFEWLDTRLTTEEILTLALEERNGRQLVRLEFRAVLPQSTRNTFWLDPEFHYLPRIVRRGRFETITEEFFEVEPGWYFPKRGWQESENADNSPARIEWVVESVERNVPNDPAWWEPPRANGTEVLDHVARQHYWHGAEPRRSPEEQYQITMGSSARGGMSVQPPKRVRYLDYWPHATIVAGGVLLLAALILWLRGDERRGEEDER